MPAKIEPSYDHVVLFRTEFHSTTESGLHLPTKSNAAQQICKVLAVGPGKVLESGERVTPWVKKDDIVLIGKYGGESVVIEGTEYQVIKEENILCRLHDAAVTIDEEKINVESF